MFTSASHFLSMAIAHGPHVGRSIVKLKSYQEDTVYILSVVKVVSWLKLKSPLRRLTDLRSGHLTSA